MRLREEVAHTGRADAHEHLDEVGPAQAEEGHPGFARHRLGQQGFARPGGPDEQHPLGDRAAQPAIVLRALEEIDDFHELGTRLVHAGHLVEGHARGLLHVDLRLTLADAHEPAGRAHAPHQKPPDGDEHQGRDDPGQQGAQPVTLDLPLKLDPGGLQLRDEGGVIELHRHEARRAAPGFAEFLDLRLREKPLQAIGHEAPGDSALPEAEVGDLARLQQCFEIAIG